MLTPRTDPVPVTFAVATAELLLATDVVSPSGAVSAGTVISTV
jgi:hypothetical protein